MTNGFGDYPEIAEAASPRIDADSQPKQKKRGGKRAKAKNMQSKPAVFYNLSGLTPHSHNVKRFCGQSPTC